VSFVLPITTPAPRVGTSTIRKIQRLWRDEGLRVPQRRRRKRLGASTTPNPPTADAPNVVWAVDFQFDATTDGRPIKIVSSVDEHIRECLGGLVERNITGRHLIDELDRLTVDRGYPAVLRCNNGPELACAAMAGWAGERVSLHLIPPGQPCPTATSSRSTAECATNASTSTCSGHWLRRGW
jgi:putative transposase